MRELEEIVLTFPDGRLVRPGDLTEWADAIQAEPDIPQEEKDIAFAIAARIRALSN